uniref:hypothetical protein n=1 Tax=Chryseobacterium indologenes TaxID=253 RepID=UPI001E435A74
TFYRRSIKCGRYVVGDNAGIGHKFLKFAKLKQRSSSIHLKKMIVRYIMITFPVQEKMLYLS